MPQRPADRRPAARLGEPISEEFVGRSDLTHWSRLGQWLVRFVLITSRLVSAHTVLLVSAVVGAALVTALSTASAEIYDNVKDADGLSGLDEPALELAMSLRNRPTWRSSSSSPTWADGWSSRSSLHPCW